LVPIFAQCRTTKQQAVSSSSLRTVHARERRTREVDATITDSLVIDLYRVCVPGVRDLYPTHPGRQVWETIEGGLKAARWFGLRHKAAVKDR
jgi:hypothetical protein